MSNKDSPVEVLKGEADRMAAGLKSLEKNLQPKERPYVKFGIAMEDKLLTIKMDWVVVRTTDEAALSALIMKHMQEKTDSS